MENQHRKITGYRELSQAEIDMMNKIKAHAEATRELSEEVHKHLLGSYQLTQHDNAQPHRWLAISRTDFQTGFMALTRAVAQPTTF